MKVLSPCPLFIVWTIRFQQSIYEPQTQQACCRDACCYYDAPSGVDLGCEPPTEAQVEALAMFCARAVEELGLSVADIYTHAEMAAFDGYGIGSGDPDMRWDLLYVPDYGDGGRLVPGGELIRGKTKYYRKQRSGLLCL